MAQSFAPYRSFLENIAAIDEFNGVTELSFGMTQQLLYRRPKDAVPVPRAPTLKKAEVSYSEADVRVEGVTEVCGWIDASEYARRTNSDPRAVSEEAQRGKFGAVTTDLEKGTLFIIWPPEQQKSSLSELPALGKKQFVVKLTNTLAAPIGFAVDDPQQFESVQEQLVALVHSLGDHEELAKRAESMLYRTCLLLYWSSFEVYIRETVDALYARHPEVLAIGKRGKATLSIAELVGLSGDLQDLDTLRTKLVERVIAAEQAEGRSVHGLINLLKTDFRFDEDPYDAWYVMGGRRQRTSYSALMKVKDVRNALLHDGGRASANFATEYPDVVEGGQIVVSSERYLESRLILKSIAHKLAASIAANRYRVASRDVR